MPSTPSGNGSANAHGGRAGCDARQANRSPRHDCVALERRRAGGTLAALHALLGAADRAVDMIEQGGLGNTPLQHRWFDLLKDNPRFQALFSSRRHEQEPRR